MGKTFYFDWEVELMEWLQGFIGDFGAQVASVMSMLGEEVILVAMLGYIFWCYDKNLGRFIGMNILVGLIMCPMLKNVMLRRRPYIDNPSIKCLRPVASDAPITDIASQGFSFPSAHTMNSTTSYLSIPVFTKNKKLLIPAIIIPIIVGVSRVMLGVHYPTDVLFGWIVGTIVVFGMSAIQKRIKRIEILYAIVTVIALMGVFYCRTEDYFTCLGLIIGFFLADIFERRYVNFKETRNPIESVIRVLGGFATYGVLNFLIKAPFSKEFLETKAAGPFALRTFRYAVIAFVAFGLYPMLFGKLGRLFNKNEHREGEGNN
ncbi:MAG: phosphatase PAP2 family protein [Eubacterium sp.]|nr:phosphatase PAP2 family protein [Eubacterium sp.]